MPSVLNPGFEALIDAARPLGDQLMSAVAGLADGGYIIFFRDSNYSELEEQTYDAQGHKVGSLVTPLYSGSTTVINGTSPAVAAFTDGGYVWSMNLGSGNWQYQGVDAGGQTIFQSGYYGAGAISSDVASLAGGTAVYATTFQSGGANGISYATAGRAYSFPSGTISTDGLIQAGVVAGLTDGGFVIAWQQSGGHADIGNDIYLERFDVAGTATPAQIVRINDVTSGDQTDPSVAGLADGGYVVVWTSQGQDGGDGGIFAQQYDAGSGSLVGEFQVNSTSAGDQSHADVAALDDGGYVVVWQGQDTSGYGIFAQRYDVDGHRIGPEMLVNSYQTNDQTDPSVAGLPGGGFVVSWTSYGQDGSGLGIYQRAFTPTTTTVGGQYIYGGEDSDLMDGGGGGDHMYGGMGDDVYVVHGAQDMVFENASEGEDTVESYISYTLGDNVEDLTLTGSAGLTGTGNLADNVIIGNTGSNILHGSYGDDYLDGGKGNDTLDGGNDDDNVNGGDGNDVVMLSPGYDMLDGGSGLDTLSASGLPFTHLTIDMAIGQAASEYGLSYFTGFEWVTGSSGNDTILGDASANSIDGANGNDTIEGGLGNDALYGGGGFDTASYATATAAVTVSLLLQDHYQDTGSAGSDYLDGIENLTGSKYNDTLTGDNGNNLLDGGAGADVMKGGLGDDTYVVGNSFDNVGERLNEGMDTVLSSITYTLPSNVEILTLTGTANLNATGNSDNNTLNGNIGNNLLDGGAGADKMYGGLGNDTYVVNNSFDQANENANEGTDTVQSSITFSIGNNVENLVLTGTAAINGTGNALANILTGNAGNNILKGGAGNDTFVFGKFGAGNGLDHLVDFVSAADHLSFTGADYGIAAGHHLTAGELSLTGVATSAAGVGQFVYNTTTHTLSWDSNGVTSGGLTSIVVFDNAATPAIGDFLFT